MARHKTRENYYMYFAKIIERDAAAIFYVEAGEGAVYRELEIIILPPIHYFTFTLSLKAMLFHALRYRAANKIMKSGMFV